MAARFGGAPKCPRCSTAVYMAEQIVGPGGLYHKKCLTCKECKKTLDAFNLLESSGEAYCKTCHSKLFGPKGYGFGGGAGVLRTETATPSQAATPAGGAAANQLQSQDTPQAIGTGATISPRSSEVNLNTEYYQRLSPRTSRAAQRNWGPQAGGGGDICPTCNKAVYAAEAVQGVGKKFHKLCFKCVRTITGK